MRTFAIILLKTSLALVIYFNPSMVYATDETRDTDVGALSLGQVRSVVGSLSNPSLMALSDRGAFGAAINQRFNMKELSTRSAYFFVPNRVLTAGAQLSYFGFADYSITQVQASAAKDLSEQFSIGASFVYLNENSFLEPAPQHRFSSDIGLYFKPSEKVGIGLLAENLLHTGDDIAAILSAGAVYKAFENFNVILEFGYDFEKEFHYSVGVEYIIAEQFAARGGFRGVSNVPSLGIAYLGQQWKAETALIMHPLLGLSTAVGLGYFF